MKKTVLQINQVEVNNTHVEYTCFGLGSCIGLFIMDRVKGIYGGAHIPYPFSSYAGELIGASRMIHEMLAAFHLLGSDLNCLRAKITGGAHIYKNALKIGEQNSSIVLQQLITRKIFIAASDVGGELSRTARFNSITCGVQISTADKKKYCI